MFADKDTESLIDSIELIRLDKFPDRIEGAGFCLDIYDKSGFKRFPICLNDELTMNEIKEVFVDFAKCRMGDNLSHDLHRVLKICDKLKNTKDSKIESLVRV